MKRPQPRRFESVREFEQHAEMERQKRTFAALEFYPHEKLCPSCQTRQPWESICPECRAKVEKGTGHD